MIARNAKNEAYQVEFVVVAGSAVRRMGTIADPAFIVAWKALQVLVICVVVMGAFILALQNDIKVHEHQKVTEQPHDSLA